MPGSLTPRHKGTVYWRYLSIYLSLSLSIYLSWAAVEQDFPGVSAVFPILSDLLSSSSPARRTSEPPIVRTSDVPRTLVALHCSAAHPRPVR
eukprot:scaffold105778_cov84-Phaeocystis_antarctica.AAC.2